ncbi:hypothetical protein ACFV7Q_30920 [Streptomyces sp. NPDC059851]|uniref:hypothetical protein n=1 Tax=Streptomyces sp. NPDC059851 TaxID=3346971 RepID=UPI00364CD0B9
MTGPPEAKAAEIKISFAGEEVAAALDALGLDRSDGRRRSIHFWDRPQLVADGAAVKLPLLDDHGAILRLRRDDTDRGSRPEADMTVKLRPCPALPPPWHEDREGDDWEFTVEEDRSGPAFTPVLAAALQAERDVAAARDAERSGTLDGVLIDRHRELLGAVGLRGDGLGGLTALGPVHALKWKQDWDGLPRAVAIEEWTTGTGTGTGTGHGLRFLEVSVRTDLSDAAEAGRLLGDALRERGITPPQTGGTKTRAVMTALARNLAGQ